VPYVISLSLRTAGVGKFASDGSMPTRIPSSSSNTSTFAPRNLLKKKEYQP
tara:strand:- start:26 stop:178 length:153 start_codon:yes stop_codon:yes gene_type:complete